MKRSASLQALPIPVERALRQLGADLAVARKRRRISTLSMCERAMISRGTLARVERGDPAVSLGIYATVLFVLGMTDRLVGLADPGKDESAQLLDEERLPKRIRSPRA